MDLRLLRYFVACVENKTMHAAAEAVHVSQPALSKAIGGLEARLGVRLLDRQPRGVVPTRYGESLFRYAKLIDSDMRRAIAELDAMRGQTRGTIVMGVIPTMSAVVGDVARIVMESHPGLCLKLRVAFSIELAPALLEGEIDFALMLLPEGAAPVGLAYEPLIRTAPVVVAREAHPLAGRRDLSVRELAAFPWLIPDYPPSHRASVNRAFIDAGVPPPSPAVEVSTVVFFDRLIQGTDLITVVPGTLLKSWGSAPPLAPLETGFQFPLEQVGLAFRQHSALLAGARVVVDLVRRLCADLPGAIEPVRDASAR